MRITARDGAVPAASVIFLVMCSATFLAAAAVAVVAVPAVLLNAVVSARAKRVINRLRQQKALLLGDRLAERTRSSTAATSSPLGAPQTA